MRNPEHMLMDFLTGPILPYLVVGVIIAAALTVGLVLVAVTIRGEDAGTRLKVRATDPIARKVRNMLSLHVYTGGPFTYRRPRNRRSQRRAGAAQSDSRWGPGYYHGPA